MLLPEEYAPFGGLYTHFRRFCIPNSGLRGGAGGAEQGMRQQVEGARGARDFVRFYIFLFLSRGGTELLMR